MGSGLDSCIQQATRMQNTSRAPIVRSQISKESKISVCPVVTKHHSWEKENGKNTAAAIVQ
ncbi:Uncharacterised protein [Legionella feeleii]|uniref:Uncharacterized protein n=1 Tax=Legionella feeleii TaxID=453 RepID=A0A378J6E0_9GAMM|nr:Uncharacterised protein [Legionella feeleii]